MCMAVHMVKHLDLRDFFFFNKKEKQGGTT